MLQPIQRIYTISHFNFLFTEEVLKINRKNKAFRKFINCKDPLTKEQFNVEYKTIKNEITTMTQKSKIGEHWLV